MRRTWIQRVLCLGFFVSMTGCAAMYGPPVLGIIEQKEVFLTPGPIEDTYAFQMYDTQYKDDRAVIMYLINLCRYSDLVFCRNNTIYTGENAARWLEYKWDRYFDGVADSASFIDDVASHSLSSGKVYYIILEKGSLCPFSQILKNELNRLRNFEKERETAKKKKEEEAAQKRAAEKAKKEEAARTEAAEKAKKEAATHTGDSLLKSAGEGLESPEGAVVPTDEAVSDVARVDSESIHEEG